MMRSDWWIYTSLATYPTCEGSLNYEFCREHKKYLNYCPYILNTFFWELTKYFYYIGSHLRVV